MSTKQVLDRVPWKVFAAICLVLPSTVVVGLRKAKSPGKATSAVAMAAAPIATPATQSVFKGLSPEQVALGESYAAYERTLVYGPSPIAQTSNAQRIVQVPKAESGASVQQEGPRAYIVSSILRSRTGDIAIVAGKVRKVGDTLPGGARIVAIRADRGEVTIVEPQGESRVLTLPRAGADE